MSYRNKQYTLESDEQGKFINRNFHDLIRLLIDSRGDMNEQNVHGYTPLQLAIMDGCLGVVRILVESGADINFQDEEGYTPLMYAILENREAIALYLIKQGAHVATLNEDGVDALDLAVEVGLFKVANLIEKVIKSLSNGAERNNFN
jgi:hypothetical protein